LPERTETRRRRNRKKTASVYIVRRITALLLFAAVVTGVVLSLTVFFNIENIEVKGMLEIYTKQEVSNASGLKKGDNILRFSAYNTKNRIIKELPYISDVVIKRVLPSTVIISVTEADNALTLVCSGGYVVLGHDMRVIDTVPTYNGKSLMIYGIEPSSRTSGKPLEAEDQNAVDNLRTMIDYLSRLGLLSEATSINTADRLDLTLLMDNRILVKFGTAGDIDRKFLMLAEMMNNQLSDTDMGILDLSVSGKATFAAREENDLALEVSNRIYN